MPSALSFLMQGEVLPALSVRGLSPGGFYAAGIGFKKPIFFGYNCCGDSTAGRLVPVGWLGERQFSLEIIDAFNAGVAV